MWDRHIKKVHILIYPQKQKRRKHTILAAAWEYIMATYIMAILPNTNDGKFNKKNISPYKQCRVSVQFAEYTY